MIFDEYAGDKNVVAFDGDHNDVRPGFFVDSACIFLRQCLLLTDEHCLDVPLDHHGRPLPLSQALRMQARQQRRDELVRSGGATGDDDDGLELTPDLLAMLGGSSGRVLRHAPPSCEHESEAAALQEFEEQLLRQAIAESLAAANGASPTGAPRKSAAAAAAAWWCRAPWRAVGGGGGAPGGAG